MCLRRQRAPTRTRVAVCCLGAVREARARSLLLAALIIIFFLFLPKRSPFWRSQHTPKLTKVGMHIRPGEKFYNLQSLHKSACRWRYSGRKRVLPYNFQTVHRIFKNFISPCSGDTYASSDVGHAHLRLEIFFATAQNVQNLLLRTPPRIFHRSASNLAHTFYRSPWPKVIKKILFMSIIAQVINKNFSVVS